MVLLLCLGFVHYVVLVPDLDMLEAGRKVISATPTWAQLVEHVSWGKDLRLLSSMGPEWRKPPKYLCGYLRGGRMNLRPGDHRPEYNGNGGDKEKTKAYPKLGSWTASSNHQAKVVVLRLLCRPPS